MLFRPSRYLPHAARLLVRTNLYLSHSSSPFSTQEGLELTSDPVNVGPVTAVRRRRRSKAEIEKEKEEKVERERADTEKYLANLKHRLRTRLDQRLKWGKLMGVNKAEVMSDEWIDALVMDHAKGANKEKSGIDPQCHYIGHASKSKSSICRACGDKIAPGDLRYGYLRWADGWWNGKKTTLQHLRPYYFHWNCVDPRLLVSMRDASGDPDWTRIQNPSQESLTSSEKERVEASMRAAAVPDGLQPWKEPERRTHRVEYAQSSRSSCKACKETIAQGSLRYGNTDLEAEQTFKTLQSTRWYHWACVPPEYLAQWKKGVAPRWGSDSWTPYYARLLDEDRDMVNDAIDNSSEESLKDGDGVTG